MTKECPGSGIYIFIQRYRQAKEVMRTSFHDTDAELICHFEVEVLHEALITAVAISHYIYYVWYLALIIIILKLSY